MLGRYIHAGAVAGRHATARAARGGCDRVLAGTGGRGDAVADGPQCKAGKVVVRAVPPRAYNLQSLRSALAPNSRRRVFSTFHSAVCGICRLTFALVGSRWTTRCSRFARRMTPRRPTACLIAVALLQRMPPGGGGRARAGADRAQTFFGGEPAPRLWSAAGPRRPSRRGC